MEHSTASQPPASEPTRTDATETGRTEKAHGNRHFKQTTLPSLGGTGPLIPESVRKFFRRKDTPAVR